MPSRAISHRSTSTKEVPGEVSLFLAHLAIQKNRPATTVRAYSTDLAKFVKFMEGLPHGWALEQIDRSLLSGYQTALAQTLPNPRSRARALVALRQFLTYAYDQEWIPSELSRHVSVPRYTATDPHPVPTESVLELLAALPRQSLCDLRDRALIHFLVATGCRISEACSVNRTDVRPDGFRVLGKGGKYRSVYCTSDALAAIADYLAVRGDDQSPALFISLSHSDRPKKRAVRANRLTPNGARHALEQLKKRSLSDPRLSSLLALLPSPHAARHTTATTLLEATDGDVRLVQEILGHATLETLKVYTEITDRRKRLAYRRLETYLGGGASTEIDSAPPARGPSATNE